MSEQATGKLVIYQAENGHTRVDCRLLDETICLSQARMGELFDRSRKTISEHLQNIFEEGSLNPDSVVRNFRTTAACGKSYEDAGSISREQMNATTDARFTGFDAKRRVAEAIAAYAEHLKAIEDLTELIQKGGAE